MRDELADRGIAPRNNAPIGALALLGIPLDGIGGHCYLGYGLGDWLALFQSEDLCHIGGALAQQSTGGVHDLRALMRRYSAPILKTCGCRGDRLFQQRRVCERDVTQRFPGRRVDDQLAFCMRIAPAAVDVELDCRIRHAISSAPDCPRRLLGLWFPTGLAHPLSSSATYKGRAISGKYTGRCSERKYAIKLDATVMMRMIILEINQIWKSRPPFAAPLTVAAHWLAMQKHPCHPFGMADDFEIILCRLTV